MGILHNHHPDWGSHLPLLIKALELTDGPVLELGMGVSSTILLHVLCEAQDRYLTSYDNDGRFIQIFKNYKTLTHDIELVEWDKLELKDNWSVVLVDHKPAEQRSKDIVRLTNSDYLVVHDTQGRAEEFYGYEEIYPLFKYKYDYTKFANQTTVLSNKHDLHQFHNTFDK